MGMFLHKYYTSLVRPGVVIAKNIKLQLANDKRNKDKKRDRGFMSFPFLLPL